MTTNTTNCTIESLTGCRGTMGDCIVTCPTVNATLDVYRAVLKLTELSTADMDDDDAAELAPTLHRLTVRVPQCDPHDLSNHLTQHTALVFIVR